MLVIILILLVRSNIESGSKEKNFLPVYVRILMNHFQLLTLTASFDLDWPPILESFFDTTKPVS